MQDQHVHLPLEADKEPTSLIQSYFCLSLNTAYCALCMFGFFLNAVSRYSQPLTLNISYLKIGPVVSSFNCVGQRP